MNAPIVTVMVPTYNQSKYVVRAIKSALDQSYKNIEILVSDDCSTDDTEQVVRNFLLENFSDRIKYFRNNTNQGILKNYHDTLARAVGKYVVNLDGDDFLINKEFLTEAVKLLQSDENVALVFGDYCELNQATNESIDIINKNLPQIMCDKYFFKKFAEDKIYWNHNTIVYKRELALGLGFYWDPETPKNDWESFLRLIVGHRVGHLPIIAAAWVQHGRNETQRPDIKKYLTNFVLISKVAEFANPTLGNSFVDSWYKKMLWIKTKSSSIAYIKNRDILGWLNFLAKVWKINPILPLRALTNLGLFTRIILSVHPLFYIKAKATARKFFRK